MPETSGIRIASAIKRLDERGYAQASRRTMQGIARSTNAPQGIIQRRLRELDNEAKRLQGIGANLTAQNPVYRQTVTDFNRVMQQNGQRMISAGPGLADAGSARASQIVRFGIGGRNLPSEWAAPDPEQISRAIGFIENGQWNEEVGNFVRGNVQAVDDIALHGLAARLHPDRVASLLRKVVEENHAKAANTLMRTMYLESARKSTAVHQTVNTRLISRVIRIEALDDRTCMACVSLHGTVIWDSEKDGVGSNVPQIDEHHNGRGTTITEVRGVSRNIETGEKWLARQSPQKQRKMFGTNSGYEAYKNGQVKLQDFVMPYQSDVFGSMVRQGSVRSALANADRRRR